MIDRFGKDRSQIRNRGIGVRVCLKVGDIGGTIVLSDALSFAGFNLFGNGSAPITGKITGPSGTAENAATRTKSCLLYTSNEDIKTGVFKQIYLLYGEEAYLKKQYKQKLTKAMISEDDTVNYTYYEGKGISTAEVIDLAETMPFFAERRLIVIENSGFFKNAAPELADYLKNLPETAYFLFVESEVDVYKRQGGRL